MSMRSIPTSFPFAVKLLPCVLIALSYVAVETVTVKAQTNSTSADSLQMGARIAADGNAKGAVACARCHGFDGASDGSGAFPTLAGQSAKYLQAQLRLYASGARPNAIMSNIARKLDQKEIDAVAEYYYTRRPDLPVSRVHDASALQRGEELALVGQLVPRVQACISCHGPQGKGEPPTVPYLAGQYQRYIQAQLEAYQHGDRINPQMSIIGHNLSKQDAAAVAAYFDQLAIPAPAPESPYGRAKSTDSTRPTSNTK
jgi:cytochrome c553